MRTIALTEETRKNVLENLLKRSPSSYGKFEDAVAEIVENVRNNKDAAVFEYTKRFDGADINARNIKVTKEEIDEAYEQVDPSLLDVIRKALVNIREYHEKQKKYSWFDSKPDGTMLGQKVMPLAKVGVYVPGGKAVYPSSVLMNVVPAKVAGVEKIIMTTPCGKDGKVYPSTLVAAMEAGADEIYKVGGAQAIAALAFGTESIPKVDKIVGPGNIYVALAKKLFTDMSALILSQDQVRSLFLLMRRQIHVSWQQIFCLRQSMTRWHLQFWLQQVWNLQRKYLHRQMHL